MGGWKIGLSAVLLDLAKSQKVDLTKISITILADQFVDYIKNFKDKNLDLAFEYLLMATWLTYLKSRLLLPDDQEDDFKASEVANKLNEAGYKPEDGKEALDKILNDEQAVGTATIEEQPKPLQVDDAVTRRDS